MSGETVELLEYVMPSGQPLKVDRERGIIYRTKILGESSANPPPRDNFYPRSTRQNVAPLLEGARVYVDHAQLGKEGETRSYRDAYGVHRNVREEGDGLYSDYHFPPKGYLSEQLFWDAENAPNRLGFSISSRGRATRRDGRNVVEEIAFDPTSHSVDLVSRPATTRGLREHRETPVNAKKNLKELIESLKTTRPDYARGLQEALDAGLMSADGAYDAPAAAVAGEADHEAALKQGFSAACQAVLADEGMDLKEKLKKLREILRAQEKLIGGDAGTPADETPGVAESKATAKLKLENAGLRLLLEAGVKPSKVLGKALAACADEAEMAELIQEAKDQDARAKEAVKEAKEAAPRPGARSAAPANGNAPAKATSGAGAVAESKVPDNPAERKSWLRS